jgi:hypothetical protein
MTLLVGGVGTTPAWIVPRSSCGEAHATRNGARILFTRIVLRGSQVSVVVCKPNAGEFLNVSFSCISWLQPHCFSFLAVHMAIGER